METDELLDILHKDCQCAFHGVFPRDTFRSAYRRLYEAAKVSSVSAIVNTADSNHPGEHWVAYYFSGGGSSAAAPVSVEFFDSYGQNPFHTYKLPPANKYNVVQVQALSSVHCGLFAAYYLLARTHKLLSMGQIVEQFYRQGDLLHNDCIVSTLLAQLVSRLQ